MEGSLRWGRASDARGSVRSSDGCRSHAVRLAPTPPGATESRPVSTAITDGIQVDVTAEYVPEHSRPRDHRYVFAYSVTITNVGRDTAQLVRRHWIITDGNGSVQEVRGDGVVGAQPVLRTGEKFQYTSGCMLTTPRGEMRGTYEMRRDDGSSFLAEISTFALALPYSLN